MTNLKTFGIPVGTTEDKFSEFANVRFPLEGREVCYNLDKNLSGSNADYQKYTKVREDTLVELKALLGTANLTHEDVSNICNHCGLSPQGIAQLKTTYPRMHSPVRVSKSLKKYVNAVNNCTVSLQNIYNYQNKKGQNPYISYVLMGVMLHDMRHEGIGKPKMVYALAGLSHQQVIDSYANHFKLKLCSTCFGQQTGKGYRNGE